MKTKTIVYGGVFAAFYIVATLAIAPLSYGAIQIRVSNLIKPIALLNPAFLLSLTIGTFVTNLFSPFGFWDWGIMPLVELGAAFLCWRMRSVPILAILVQSIIITLGVCLFPLGIAGHIPVETTILPVMIPNVLVPLLGYFFVWRRPDIKKQVA